MIAVVFLILAGVLLSLVLRADSIRRDLDYEDYCASIRKDNE